MSTADRHQLPALLERGAEGFGFRGEVWICGRVAKVVQRTIGVKYHPAHISRILKKFGCTPKKPIWRSKQRNAEEIQ